MRDRIEDLRQDSKKDYFHGPTTCALTHEVCEWALLRQQMGSADSAKGQNVAEPDTDRNGNSREFKVLDETPNPALDLVTASLEYPDLADDDEALPLTLEEAVEELLLASQGPLLD